MKSRYVFLFFALNAAALCAGFLFMARSNDRSRQAAVAAPRPIHPAELRHAGPRTAPAPVTIVQTNQFHWSQVESGDYREYIANLRAIGCPEPTIKDIILTDVMRLYAARRGEFYHVGTEFRFWETDEKRKLTARQLEERERQLAFIDKELPAVLRELLGINYDREVNRLFVDTNEDDRRLAFLPENKRARLLALREEIEGMRERVLDAAGGVDFNSADRDALRKIEDYHQAALGALLSESEMEEYTLRMSDTANRLRAELIGFNPSPEEFRDVFRLRRELDKKFAFADLSDARVQQEFAAEQNRVEQALQAALGVSRFAEYERAKHADYREACVFVRRYELPAETAQEIFEIQQIVQNETRKLLAQRLADEQRTQALSAIQEETERSMRDLLGAEIFSTYARTAGQWIHRLAGN